MKFRNLIHIKNIFSKEEAFETLNHLFPMRHAPENGSLHHFGGLLRLTWDNWFKGKEIFLACGLIYYHLLKHGRHCLGKADLSCTYTVP
jgi:hypothetical protein